MEKFIGIYGGGYWGVGGIICDLIILFYDLVFWFYYN